MRTFFTADDHYGHSNIIRYSSRPFKDVDAMDNELIHRFNAVVGQDDVCYHLGDFSLGHKSASYYRNRLNCKTIHLAAGNHDKAALKEPHLWASISNLSEIKVDDQRIVLCHYAMRVWRGSHRGAIHLYGHSHGSLPDDPHALSLDVGVDCWDYYPVSMAQIKQGMARKTWKAIDHHG